MRKVLCVIFMAVVWALCTGTAGAASVQVFSPEGTVKEIRQVAVRFTDQMVAFGDPRPADPFDIRCSQPGKGRWIDGKNWSYDFEKALPAGVACTFTIKPNLKTLSGASVTGKRAFSFNTGGPAVRQSDPWEGSEDVEEHQTFLLRLDAPATDASVAKNVFCVIEGVRERVGIRLITGEERKKILTALGESKKERDDVVLFQCRQAFPPKSKVKIIWGKGIMARSGMATTADQVLTFKAREPFTASSHCLKEKPKSGCIPLAPIRLSLTSPISGQDAEKIVIMVDDKKKTWKAKSDRSGDRETTSVSFEGPFPERSTLTIRLPENLKDISGRPLANARNFPLAVKTDSYPVLAKFPDRFGVIESKEGAVLPVTVRNIEREITIWRDKPDKGAAPAKPGASPAGGEKASTATASGSVYTAKNDDQTIIEWLRKLDGAPRERSILKGTPQGEKFTLPRPGATKDFEVIGIPLRGTGFHIVEIESRMLGDRLFEQPGPMYVPAAALVTNMVAHFKWGRESSLVFVTALDTGDPVPDASVSLRNCEGGLVWQGKADSNGIAMINTGLPLPGSLPTCSRPKQESKLYYESSRALSDMTGGIFVFARSGSDMTFTHSSWNDGIEAWRFNLPDRFGDAPREVIAHTVFDRTLFRAGETVHMKHFARHRTMQGLTVPPAMKDLDEVLIVHGGSNEKYTVPLKWRENGTAENIWKIPPVAKLGTYEVSFRKTGDERRLFHAGSFRVEEFRVPLMRGFIRGPREPAINAGSVDVDIDVRYLSGGGAADLPVKVRAAVDRKRIEFPDYEDFVFSTGAVKTGVQKEGRGDRFVEDEGEGLEDEGEEGSDRADDGRVKLKTIDLVLDKNGTARTSLRDIPKSDVPRAVLSELEFRDPNGEVQTSSTRIPLYTSGLHVGIAASGDQLNNMLKYQVVVVDLAGKPVPNADVRVKIYKRSVYSHRRRIAGGFYAFEHVTERKEIGDHCAGKTAGTGILYCEGKTPQSGEIIIEAQVKDNSGRPSFVNRETTVYGKDDTWFETRNDDRIELIPVKRFVEPGESMAFEVRMPFRAATILMTVEREGAMDAYVRKATRENPVIEIPVKNNYVPNVFVSALVVRGRVAGSKPTAMFDPGKPAYKLGITEVRVGWKPHAMKVRVDTDKKVYSVREAVKTHIEVKTPEGRAPRKGSEVAVAVVDEGLLELKPNLSWALLEAMMRRKPYEMSTSTSQMMVVGKRHFGRKAIPHGGGGGKQLTRELFDTLIFWKSTVMLDDNGQADVTFNLNDSLTSFRVVAIANSGLDLFGTGETSIRTSQDLMILPGIPQVVRESDKFTAGFTVRNTSDRAMDVTASLKLNEGKGQRSLDPITLNVPPGQAKDASWQITVPHGVTTIDYEASARETSGKAIDTMKVSQKVVPAVTPRVFQATLTQIKDKFAMDVERPSDAIPGRGGVSVAMQARLADVLQGVTDYMRQYPYGCLEQKTSKAIALRDTAMWKDIMASLAAYLDSDGLAKYFPTAILRGGDTLSSYLLSISAESGFEIPQALRVKMIAGLKGFVEGKIVRYSDLDTADLSIRKMAAVAALSYYKESTPQQLTSIAIEPNLWPTSAVLDWITVLRRTSGIPERDQKLKAAGNILRSRLNLQGTTMGISTERTDFLYWLMVSTDVNAARTLIASMDFAAWAEDVPRIARGLAGRMKRGRWDTTTANAWGVVAMDKFSRKFENVPVSGTTAVGLAQKHETVAWAEGSKGSRVMLPWPEKKSTLTIEHRGKGRPWATVQSIAAIALKAPFSSGYVIKKTVTAVERKNPNAWTRGDVMKVKLEIDSRSDMTWVVVSDPIPSGSVILGSGLGQDSALLSKQGSQRGWAWEAFRERSFEALRVYYRYVPRGTWTVEYAVRLNNDGLFHMPETRVEALYSPEMFGEFPNKAIEVRK